MKKIIRLKGKYKTSALIKLSAENGGYIVTSTLDRANEIQNRAIKRLSSLIRADKIHHCPFYHVLWLKVEFSQAAMWNDWQKLMWMRSSLVKRW